MFIYPDVTSSIGEVSAECQPPPLDHHVPYFLLSLFKVTSLLGPPQKKAWGSDRSNHHESPWLQYLMSITANTNYNSETILYMYVSIKAHLSRAAGTGGGLRARLPALCAHTKGWSSNLSPWAWAGPEINSVSSPSLLRHTWNERVKMWRKNLLCLL